MSFWLFVVLLIFFALMSFASAFYLTADDLVDHTYFDTLIHEFWKFNSMAAFLFNGLFALLMNLLLKLVYRTFETRVSLYRIAKKMIVSGSSLFKITSHLDSKYRHLIKSRIM